MSRESMNRQTSALLHPGFVCALIILALNDHWGKQAWPCWLTGKLSDIAGAIVFPIVVATLCGRAYSRHQALGLGSALTAGLYLLKNLGEGGAGALSSLLSLALAGSHLTSDPSDLATLAATPVAWWISAHALARFDQRTRCRPLCATDRSALLPAKAFVLVASLFIFSATSEPETHHERTVAPHFSVEKGVISILVQPDDEYVGRYGSPTPERVDQVILQSRDGGDTWVFPTNSTTSRLPVEPTGSTCRGAAPQDPCYYINPKFRGSVPTATALIERRHGAARNVWVHTIDRRRKDRAIDETRHYPYDVPAAASLTDVVQLSDGSAVALNWPTSVVVKRNGRWTTRPLGLKTTQQGSLLDQPEAAMLLVPALALVLMLMFKRVADLGGCLTLVLGLAAVVASWFGFFTAQGNFANPDWSFAVLIAGMLSVSSLIFLTLRCRNKWLVPLPVLGFGLNWRLWESWSQTGNWDYSTTRTAVIAIAVVAYGLCAWNSMIPVTRFGNRSNHQEPSTRGLSVPKDVS
jgi:hypothetical protein